VQRCGRGQVAGYGKSSGKGNPVISLIHHGNEQITIRNEATDAEIQSVGGRILTIRIVRVALVVVVWSTGFDGRNKTSIFPEDNAAAF